MAIQHIGRVSIVDYFYSISLCTVDKRDKIYYNLTKSTHMTQAKKIRNRINTLDYNQEYSAAIFDDIASQETIKKTLQRSQHIIAKTSTKKFYRLYLEDSIDMIPYLVGDNQDIIEFNPKEYTFNTFWQTSKVSIQNVSAVIRNYLGTMNPQDIHTLCKNFGRNRVKRELIQKYKEMYAQGFINIKGMEITLEGRYDRNSAYREILGMINDC